MEEESGRHFDFDKVIVLWERIRDLRRHVGLPDVQSLHTIRTAAERAAGLEAPFEEDVSREEEFRRAKDHQGVAMTQWGLNHVMRETVSNVDKLAMYLSANTPDREHINRRYWALKDALTALREALKPKPDPTV